MLYQINERLTHTELIASLSEIKKKYGNRYYKHTNGDTYYVVNGTTVNKSGAAHWGVIYHPVYSDGTIEHSIPHTRTLEEFTDGRFVEVSGIA